MLKTVDLMEVAKPKSAINLLIHPFTPHCVK